MKRGYERTLRGGWRRICDQWRTKTIFHGCSEGLQIGMPEGGQGAPVSRAKQCTDDFGVRRQRAGRS